MQNYVKLLFLGVEVAPADHEREPECTPPLAKNHVDLQVKADELGTAIGAV